MKNIKIMMVACSVLMGCMPEKTNTKQESQTSTAVDQLQSEYIPPITSLRISESFSFDAQKEMSLQFKAENIEQLPVRLKLYVIDIDADDDIGALVLDAILIKPLSNHAIIIPNIQKNLRVEIWSAELNQSLDERVIEIGKKGELNINVLL